MKIDNSVFGVLNYEQFEKFCDKMKLKPENIKANFDGWRKLVLESTDKVFLFPRDPNGVEWLDIEMLAYEVLNKQDYIPAPILFKRIKDQSISYYEFAVVSKLKGIAYSKLENNVTYENVKTMLRNLSELFALWHDIPLESIPQKIKDREIYDASKYEWEIRILDQKTMKKSLQVSYKILEDYLDKQDPQIGKELLSEDTILLWTDCLEEIVNLDHVLLHSDIHEDQILVSSEEDMEITGILDWETVRINNPVWEFNFFEWGFGIWEWRKNFNEFRRMMWKDYLKKRKINLKSSEGLNLFYALSEFLRSLEKPIANNEDSVILSVLSLVDSTQKIREEKM
jgi:aminoglycoside phosphotransferase (APT) family kinase protein